MSDKDKATALLEGAYALQTAADNIAYYRDFAPLYDQQFAAELGYAYPHAIASVYQQYRTNDDGPMVDIGCGTGLVAQAMMQAIEQTPEPSNAQTSTPSTNQTPLIDGVDVSPDMLAAAKTKNLYRHLLLADLSAGTSAIAHQYGAIVSAGTFTHGHLGAEVLPSLLTIAKPGALFCIGVNSQHYEAQGFAALLADLQTQGRINQPTIETADIYTATDATHAGDKASILVFRKTANNIN